ncbi:hypothetical protein N3K66_003089 [Trichothecium roseum]|uniref:Uncharacterized protein n=1 Tax=Trichothecium roseum TaxID=47278 RepID=A0ACC0V538_9HYPO|nr:hypothetical protein N3K66_003089 [Trichothecium roseum]
MMMRARIPGLAARGAAPGRGAAAAAARPRARARFGSAHAAVRSYSVRVLGDDETWSASPVKTVADLKSWKPDLGGARGGEVPDVEVSGWVRAVRKSSGVRFVDLVDGSSMRPVQAVVGKDLASDIRVGAALNLRGKWHNSGTSPSGEEEGVEEGASSSSASVEANAPPQPQTELRVSQVELLGPSDPGTNPIQHKYQTSESLRYTPHLRSRTPINGTMLRFRSDAAAVLTQFFFKEGYQQTHPPIITSSDCEGAGETFSVLDGDLSKPSGGAEGQKPQHHFFKSPKYLTVSAQFHLEAMAQSLGNVWTLSPTFRAEKSDTSRHLSEFYMLEAEMSFVDEMDDVMGLVQNMMKSLAEGLRQLRAAQELRQNRSDSKEPAERLAFADLESQDELERRWRGLLVAQTWPRITYTEAVDMLQQADVEFQHAPVWGGGLQSEHEQYLARKLGFDEEQDAYVPVFITQYPRDVKAFYMRESSSPPPQGQTVDCFDLVVPDLGELAGGSMREHRLDRLQGNIKHHNLEAAASGKALGWYVDLRRWGSPPHGGFGLGFDRLLSYLTGVTSVRDVVPFPRHYQRCDC